MNGPDPRPFLKSLARTRHPLLAAVASFSLAARVTPQTPDALADVLTGSRAAPRPSAPASFAALRLGRVLPGLSGAGRDELPDFRDPWRRLALLPPDRLIRLADWYGLAALRADIVRRMEREAVDRLRRRVGEEGRAFVLRRAGLLFGDQVPRPAEPEDGAPLEERIGRLGRQALLACLGPDARAELAPSLPPGFLEPLPGVALPGTRRVWPVLHKLVAREIAPEWAPWFR